MNAHHDIHDEAMIIRLLDGGERDAKALRELAERDGELTPPLPVLGAWVGETLLAAAPLGEGAGRVLADPFRHSAGAAAILTSRVEQIRGTSRAREARAGRAVAWGRRQTA